MTLFYDTFPTPFGDFSVATNSAGAVVATAFGDRNSLSDRLRVCHVIRDKLPESRRGQQKAACHLSDDNGVGAEAGSDTGDLQLVRDRAMTRAVREQVLAYGAGERRAFDLPLAMTGTAFQQRVWAELRRILHGETRTYGQIAAAIRTPAASRAVGAANGANPVCLIVPCHRVIGSDGSLTGFAFGEETKRQLLEFEHPTCEQSPRRKRRGYSRNSRGPLSGARAPV